MAKVQPISKSDEDSAIEVSPREDLYEEVVWNLSDPTFYASDSEFSEDEEQAYNVTSSCAVSSTYNMAQSLSTKPKSVPRRINVRIANAKSSTRRGRKRSIEDDENILEEELSRTSQKHQSKNAINARINRIKKKKYMQSLEDSLNAYKNECQRWQAEYRQKSSEVQSLQNQVNYLKGVIQNDTKLSELVRNFSRCVNAQLPNTVNPRETKPVSLVKGTNLSQTSNVKPFPLDQNKNESLNPEIIYSNLLLNSSSLMNDFSNFETDSLNSESGLSVSEDMTFESVFPSASDFFNFDLPENVEESSLFSPDTLPESSVDSKLSSSNDGVGICLHVSTISGLSLEFCSHCSKSAFPEQPVLTT